MHVANDACPSTNGCAPEVVVYGIVVDENQLDKRIGCVTFRNRESRKPLNFCHHSQLNGRPLVIVLKAIAEHVVSDEVLAEDINEVAARREIFITTDSGIRLDVEKTILTKAIRDGNQPVTQVEANRQPGRRLTIDQNSPGNLA